MTGLAPSRARRQIRPMYGSLVGSSPFRLTHWTILLAACFSRPNVMEGVMKLKMAVGLVVTGALLSAQLAFLGPGG